MGHEPEEPTETHEPNEDALPTEQDVKSEKVEDQSIKNEDIDETNINTEQEADDKINDDQEETKEGDGDTIIMDTDLPKKEEEKPNKSDKKGKGKGKSGKGGKKDKKGKKATEAQNVEDINKENKDEINEQTELTNETKDAENEKNEFEDDGEEHSFQNKEEQDATKSEQVKKEASSVKVEKKGKKGKKEKKGKKGDKGKSEPETKTEPIPEKEPETTESKPDLEEEDGDESRAELSKKKRKKGKSKSKIDIDEDGELKDVSKKSRSRIKTTESHFHFDENEEDNDGEPQKRTKSKKKLKKGQSKPEFYDENEDEQPKRTRSKKELGKNKSKSGMEGSRLYFMAASRDAFDDESDSSDEQTKQKKSDGEVRKRKGKKGKKGKKPKAEDSEIIETEAEKDLKEAMAQVLEGGKEDKEIDKKKGKKGKKDGKSKKGKTPKPKKLSPEQLEKLMKEQEELAKTQAEEERRLLLEEMRRAEEEDKRHLYEFGLRTEQLGHNYDIKQEIEEYNQKLKNEENIKKEWETYLDCRTLPDGTKCPELTTYLHTWNEEIELTTLENASKRTTNLLTLLEELEDGLILLKNESGNTYNNLVWVRQLLRDCQDKSLNEATFALLRFVETKMNRINMNLADYDFEDDNIIFSLWLRKQLPIPLPNPRRPLRPRVDIDFKTLKLSILCPLSLDGEGLAIRALYHRYDHYSDLSASFEMPDVDDVFNIGILDYSNMQWRSKQMYKFENRVRKPPKVPNPENEETGSVKVENEEPNFDDIIIGPEDPIPSVPWRKLDPTPTEYVVQMEENLYQTTREKMHIEMEENAINLRQFTILGGVYKIDLLKQPPQPQDFILINMYITTLLLPKQLEYIPFFVEYTPPVPPEEGAIRTPEEIEEDLKKNEEEMDKLILVNLKWPDHVLFLDLPFVCFWEEDKKQWTRKNVFDLKHVEDAGTLSFRTQNFGTFALGTLRYSHLPIQTWELRPEEDGTATLQITSAILIFEFNVKNNLICLQLQNCPNNALKDNLGKYYPLHFLMRIMKEAGLDIFPSFDAFLYVEGVCEKHWHMERHCCRTMSQMYNSFQFTWSRWNVSTGRRRIVLQMREYAPNKLRQKNYSMALVTPERATFIECTEISPNFTEDDIEGMKYCADLYQLMRTTSTIMVRTTVHSANKETVFSLGELLIATRIHSFS